MELPRFCLLCDLRFKTDLSKYICENCFLDLHFIKEKKQVVSILYYNDMCRSLVLNAKIKQNIIACECLLDIVVQSELTKSIMKNIDVIAPVPSSVFSRFFGRIDLAWMLALRLSIYYNKKFISSPYFMYWNFKKRSFKNKRQNTCLKRFAQHNSIAPKLLVIDDVVTTGYSLARVGSFFCPSYNLKFLTIASAIFV
jgi:predicted amidophosphoribosyltransferase